MFVIRPSGLSYGYVRGVTIRPASALQAAAERQVSPVDLSVQQRCQVTGSPVEYEDGEGFDCPEYDRFAGFWL